MLAFVASVASAWHFETKNPLLQLQLCSNRLQPTKQTHATKRLIRAVMCQKNKQHCFDCHFVLHFELILGLTASIVQHQIGLVVLAACKLSDLVFCSCCHEFLFFETDLTTQKQEQFGFLWFTEKWKVFLSSLHSKACPLWCLPSDGWKELPVGDNVKFGMSSVQQRFVRTCPSALFAGIPAAPHPSGTTGLFPSAHVKRT